jgi:hypothetical protein
VNQRVCVCVCVCGPNERVRSLPRCACTTRHFWCRGHCMRVRICLDGPASVRGPCPNLHSNVLGCPSLTAGAQTCARMCSGAPASLWGNARRGCPSLTAGALICIRVCSGAPASLRVCSRRGCQPHCPNLHSNVLGCPSLSPGIWSARVPQPGANLLGCPSLTAGALICIRVCLGAPA